MPGCAKLPWYSFCKDSTCNRDQWCPRADCVKYMGVVTMVCVMYDIVVKEYMVTCTCMCCNGLVIEVRFFDCS